MKLRRRQRVIHTRGGPRNAAAAPRARKPKRLYRSKAAAPAWEAFSGYGADLAK